MRGLAGLAIAASIGLGATCASAQAPGLIAATSSIDAPRAHELTTAALSEKSRWHARRQFNHCLRDEAMGLSEQFEAPVMLVVARTFEHCRHLVADLDQERQAKLSSLLGQLVSMQRGRVLEHARLYGP